MTVTSLRAQENVEDSRWETAVRCIKKYEGWHGPEHYPYVAYGHRIRKGEKFPVSLTESEGDSILRKDLKEMCALFRHLGKDSLLVACLAYQVGPYRLLGYGRIPKSTLIRKLEAGNRDIYATSYDIVTIRERKFRQLKGEEKKNTDYCLCHRKQDSREFIMIHGCLVIISCLKKVTGDK